MIERPSWLDHLVHDFTRAVREHNVTFQEVGIIALPRGGIQVASPTLKWEAKSPDHGTEAIA
jgi:hypothetical protein